MAQICILASKDLQGESNSIPLICLRCNLFLPADEAMFIAIFSKGTVSHDENRYIKVTQAVLKRG
jgi:hypothetical protein